MKMPALLVILAIFIFSVGSCTLPQQSEKDQEILSLLTETCSCETISSDISSFGIQLNRKKDITIGESYSYVLKDCDVEDMESERKKVYEAFTSQLDDFSSIANISLMYYQKDSKHELIFKNKKDC